MPNNSAFMPSHILCPSPFPATLCRCSPVPSCLHPAFLVYMFKTCFMGGFITPLASLLLLILRFSHPLSSIYLKLTSCFPFLRSVSLLPAASSDYSALLPCMYVSLLVPLPPPLSISPLAPSRGTDPFHHRSHISKSLCHHVSAVLNVASGAGDEDYIVVIVNNRMCLRVLFMVCLC